MKIYGIYSAGGFVREIKSSLDKYLHLKNKEDYDIVFIDDNIDVVDAEINNCKVISYENFLTYPNKEINIAFADSVLRKKK